MPPLSLYTHNVAQRVHAGVLVVGGGAKASRDLMVVKAVAVRGDVIGFAVVLVNGDDYTDHTSDKDDCCNEAYYDPFVHY